MNADDEVEDLTANVLTYSHLIDAVHAIDNEDAPGIFPFEATEAYRQGLRIAAVEIHEQAMDSFLSSPLPKIDVQMQAMGQSSSGYSSLRVAIRQSTRV